MGYMYHFVSLPRNFSVVIHTTLVLVTEHTCNLVYILPIVAIICSTVNPYFVHVRYFLFAHLRIFSVYIFNVPGDWLMEPLKVGTLKFDGLVTEKECRRIHLLGYQGKITNVQVKYGIPSIPAFFITYIVYLCKDYLLTLM